MIGMQRCCSANKQHLLSVLDALKVFVLQKSEIPGCPTSFVVIQQGLAAYIAYKLH